MNMMKKLLLTTCLFLLSACGEYQLEQTEDETAGETENEVPYTLQLKVGSQDNAKINYPLSLFVFDDKNNCVMQESISEENSEYSASMPKGKYTLILLSGLMDDNYSYPLEIIPDSYITLRNNNRSDAPLLMGKVSVNLTQSTRITVNLSYAVASLTFTLNGIPAQATSVEVSVSPVSSGISFNGDYKNDKRQCVIPCTKKGSRWISDAVYIFPNEGSQTHLSINVQSPDGNEAYGYTYQANLKAGYPYHFTGHYKGSVSLDGEFQVDGWQPEVDCEFGFDEILPDEDNDDSNTDSGKDDNDSDNTDSTETPDDTEEADTFIVPELPDADTIWGYFYVWQITSLSASECEAILIAPDQWYTLAADASGLLNAYEKDDIGGWRMFTTEEAVAFRTQFQGAVGDLNTFISEYGFDRFKYTDGARYLCNDGQSTFSLANNRILDAGKTVDYYLRPVKTVRFKLQ